MKKILFTIFLFCICATAAFSTPLSSPLYMPKPGQVFSDIRIGYEIANFNKITNATSDELKKSWIFAINGKYGLFERLAIDYGATLNFERKIFNKNESASLVNYYFGFTSRFLDYTYNKFDLILNLGQEEYEYNPDYKQIFLRFGLKYNLDLKYYNLAISALGKYTNNYKKGNETLKRSMVYSLKMENEIIFTEIFTVGVDLFYTFFGKIKYNTAAFPNGIIKSYNEYGANLDLNVRVNSTDFISIYGSAIGNDINLLDRLKNKIEYKFGIRYLLNF